MEAFVEQIGRGEVLNSRSPEGRFFSRGFYDTNSNSTGKQEGSCEFGKKDGQNVGNPETD